MTLDLFRQQDARSPRVPFKAKVRVMIDSGSWRYLLSVSALNISESGLLALITEDAASDDFTAKDLHGLLGKGLLFTLQIEHDESMDSTPLVQARLTRKQLTHQGLEIAFAFQGDDVELTSLVREIADKTRPTASPFA